MTIPENIAGLATRLTESLSGTRTEVSASPLGGAMLDVWCGERLFVLSFTPTRQFEVDEVRDGEGFVLDHAFHSEQFEAAANHLWNLVANAQENQLTQGATAELSLVVLRAKSPGATVKLFTSFGLTFLPEKHGRGPEHYSCRTGGTVLEIYPRRQEDNGSEGTRLGFRVRGLETVVARVKEQGATVVSEPTCSPWGRRAVVRDPDGHEVDLYEAAGA